MNIYAANRDEKAKEEVPVQRNWSLVLDMKILLKTIPATILAIEAK